MATVVVLSVFNGFSDLASAHLSVLDPDLTVTRSSRSVIADADSLAGVLERVPGVEAAAPVLTQRGLLTNDELQTAVVFKGVPADYSRVVSLDTAAIAAAAFTEAFASDGAGVTDVSVGVANRLSLLPGMSGLELYVPRRTGRINPANPAASFHSTPLVAGRVLQIDQAEFDVDHIYVPLEAARDILEYTTGASAIELKIAPEFDVRSVRKEIISVIGPEYACTPADELHSHSLMMISVEKWVTFSMLVFIMLIAAFNIVSTLSLLVIEKRLNMATLSFLGAPASMIRGIFMWMGGIITCAGGASGIILGVILVLAQQWGGFIHLAGDPSQLTVSVYPVRLDGADILAVAAIVLAVAGASALITRLFTRPNSPTFITR